MNILGISCHYHESAAALVRDGRISAAAAEERFTRIKHDPSFPSCAIQFCIEDSGLSPDAIDYVAFYEKPLVAFERTLTISMREFPWSGTFFVRGMKNAFAEKLWIKSIIMDKLGIPGDRILFIPQHLSHAAASFYPSPFKTAAYLTLDAVGEWSTGSWGTASANKIYPQKELRFPHSVGLLYSAFTRALGFEVNDGEFKVMGMAAYGKPIYAQRIKRLYRQFADGSIELDLSYFSFHQSSSRMYTRKFEELFADCSRFDLGASIQAVAEEIILNMARAIQKQTGEKNLVFGGGVALNSVVNGMLTKKTGFRSVFIFPAAGDDGAAAGAALYVHHHILGNTKRYQLDSMFVGPSYSDTEITSALKRNKLKFSKMSDRNLLAFCNTQLVRGKAIGWFEGRAEYGPRALGHRSILADPRKSEMKDIVNEKIKFREEFRPFAPVVLKKFSQKLFHVTAPLLSPFMLGTFRASLAAQRIAPAVVHDDRTSRIQIVDTKTYPGRYAKLVQAFYAKTRVPVLLNTSFNVKGEPIVNSPEDAIHTFVHSGLDVLILENYVCIK